MSAGRLIVFVLLALLVSPTRAAVLTHEFLLQGSTRGTGGGGTLTLTGGDITLLGYVFAAQTITASSGVPGSAEFGLEFTFTLASVGPLQPQLISGTTNTTGLDVQAAFQVGGSGGPTPSLFHVVVTRGPDGLTRGYVNGQLSFTLTGTAAPAALNTAFTFNIQDANGAPVAAAGILGPVRIFSGGLSASEVAALYVAASPLAIPEPSTWAMLGCGAALLAYRRWRRRS